MQVEIRNAGREAHISGYVNAVERDSRRLPKSMSPGAATDFVERVQAGAFARAIAANKNIRMLFNHGREIGSTAGGTLKLSEDNIGLKAEAVVTDPEVVEAAKRGSFAGGASASVRPFPNGRNTTAFSAERFRISRLTRCQSSQKSPRILGLPLRCGSFPTAASLTRQSAGALTTLRR